MGKCIVCGVDIAPGCKKCMGCSKKAVQAMFRESPELRRAYKETLEEMRQPENIEKMAVQIAPIIQAVAALGKEQGDGPHD